MTTDGDETRTCLRDSSHKETRAIPKLYHDGTPGLSFQSTKNDTAYRVLGGYVTSGAVVIPATYNNKPVVEIGNSAFARSSITSVTIPASVTRIGIDAFIGCINLTSVTISEGVTTIDTSAFTGCISLSSINLPASLMSIGIGAFSGCTGLSSININLPSSLTSIDHRAFNYCPNLSSITIPASVRSIGNDAFEFWTYSQTIYVAGHVSEVMAVATWGTGWLKGNGAIRKYWNGSA